MVKSQATPASSGRNLPNKLYQFHPVDIYQVFLIPLMTVYGKSGFPLGVLSFVDKKEKKIKRTQTEARVQFY